MLCCRGFQVNRLKFHQQSICEFVSQIVCFSLVLARVPHNKRRIIMCVHCRRILLRGFDPVFSSWPSLFRVVHVNPSALSSTTSFDPSLRIVLMTFMMVVSTTNFRVTSVVVKTTIHHPRTHLHLPQITGVFE